MNKYYTLTLKVLKRLYDKTHPAGRYDDYFKELSYDPQVAADIVKKHLEAEKPCMIARFGATEIACVCNCIAIKYHQNEPLNFIKDQVSEWWWNEKIMKQMQEWSGFFPPVQEKLIRFSELMVEDAGELDVLVSWQHNEIKLKGYLPEPLDRIKYILFDPFWAENPWTEALAGKKVLVVHPFAGQIERQYRNNREKLFKNPKTLPAFELKTICAVQSLGGDCSGFSDWFEALQWMKDEMDKVDYDIALIGCGAYGFPLAAHAKRTGHKGIHLAGSLQLLFGIKGSRWMNPNHGACTLFKKGSYPELFNEYWEWPDEIYRSQNADRVEGSAYWK